MSLQPWQTFYEIIGCSGATLIGVQFVVIVLVASVRRQSDFETINAFGTPTVVHFGSALTIAAIMTAPWSSLGTSLLGPSIALTIHGLISVIYAANVIRRARRQQGYKPVFEDWLWYAILPCTAYAALILGGSHLQKFPTIAPFVIGTVALSLLLIGVHNAWDSITHIAVSGVADVAKSEPKKTNHE